jgi:hypothetical protein
MAMHKLSARKVESAAAGKHEDGAGLRLVVSGTNAKKWVIRFSLSGKRREMGLGSYPDVKLVDARKKAAECRALAKEGIDPIFARCQRQLKTDPLTGDIANLKLTHP